MCLALRSDEWYSLSREERVRRCRRMAAEAEELAANASLEMKDPYVMLANNWLQLASEIEQSMAYKSG